MCSKIRYPHPGERKNEWSFSGEDDLKQWVLTADSDWGEGYRWLASKMMAHCYDGSQSLPYFTCFVSSPWLSLACEVLHNLRLTHWAIVFSKGNFQRGNTSCPIFSSHFIPAFRVPADGRIQNAGYVNISSVPKTSAFAQVFAIMFY